MFKPNWNVLEPEFVGSTQIGLVPSERELRSGWAEMAKHALLKNYSEYALETLVLSGKTNQILINSQVC